MDEKSYIKNLQRIVVISSVMIIISLLAGQVRRAASVTWKDYQEEYGELLDRVNEASSGSFTGPDKAIYHVEPGFQGKVDRCITCHLGIEDENMNNVPQPHTLHPGNHLAEHPLPKYGCTICHGGQGRAVTKEAAHALDPDLNWPFPLLFKPYLQSSCGKCHLSIFGNEKAMEGTEHFLAGRTIFAAEGCLGCHKARGVGGVIGPDLTEQGEKNKHGYSFRNVQGEQTVSNWLKEHFKNPEMVSPGSKMLSIDLPEKDLEDLTTFVMGLSKPDIPVEYFTLETLKELKGNRERLQGSQVYSFTCSACHGKKGQGKDYLEYKTGVPGIMNTDFLRVASGDFILFTLMKGRSRREMASWAPQISGWTEEELILVVETLKGLTSISLQGELFRYREGNVEKGTKLFNEKCTTCHGQNGKGGIAPALKQKDFLEIADGRFIAQTIIRGRNNSGMPGWPFFDREEIEDLLALLNSWYPVPDGSVTIRLPAGDPATGKLRFHYLCSRCHGQYGEGETGPAILNRDFLNAATDWFLYKTIAMGRSHTAMFGWSTDVYNSERLGRQEISDIIAYLRSMEQSRLQYINPGANPGNPERGESLFGQHCTDCHGKQGEGIRAPALNNQEFLNAASNGYLMATITVGRKGTRMPSWGYPGDAHPLLSGSERQDIVAFLRSWQRIRIRY